MSLRVQSGFSDHQRGDVARLFWAAFETKLTLPLGPEDRALRFIEGGLNPAYAFSATDQDGRLLGVAGVRMGQGGLFTGDLRSLASIYGWVGAFWRGAILSLFERDLREGQLLMDGIFVAPEARGQGVGTQLLDSVIWCAKMNRCHAVRLDVVDTNPRARALYERYGFQAVGTEEVGFLSRWLGFRRAITMVYVLDEQN